MGDSNPRATFGYVADQLAKRGIAFLLIRESLGENRLVPELKRRFGGVLIANEGFTRESAHQILESGEADAVSFGRTFIANPDLPRRLQLNGELNPPDGSTFYGYGLSDFAVGYTDYPERSYAPNPPRRALEASAS